MKTRDKGTGKKMERRIMRRESGAEQSSGQTTCKRQTSYIWKQSITRIYHGVFIVSVYPLVYFRLSLSANCRCPYSRTVHLFIQVT